MNYLITFTATTEKLSAIIEQIKQLGEWGEITPNSFVVASNENAGVITQQLQMLLGPHDSIAVFSVSQPWASYCDLIVEDFLVSEIGEYEDWTPRDWNGDTQSREE